MRFFLGVLVVVCALAPGPAPAQDCSGIADPDQQQRCLAERARHRISEVECLLDLDMANAVECMRALRMEQNMARLCDTDELKADKAACLERKVEFLTRELFNLRRDLAGLIKQGVREALEPRVHK